MTVRSIHFAFDVPDCRSAQATLFYPADVERLDEARLTGLVPPSEEAAPWPLVILLPGINVAPDGYRWLAHHAVRAGCAFVTYSAIGSLGPAGTGITPGIDLQALAPDVMGTRCSASAIGPLLATLRGLNEQSIVAGHLDLDRVVLGGHSAGGTVALHNTQTDWIPGLQAAFVYGAHTMTATNLGHDEASIVSIPAQVPVLLASGSTDSVIAASRDRYRSDDGEHDPVGRTFDEAIDRDAGDCWFVELTDGNHFTMCDPVDETSGRSFLEPDLRSDDDATRQLLAQVITGYLHAILSDDEATLLGTLEQPGISKWARK